MKLSLFLVCSALVACCSQASIIISPESTYVEAGDSFNFTCVTNTTDLLTSLVILINNKPADTDRLTNTTVTANQQYKFTYSDALASENGLSFVCQNKTQKSEALTMEVYYVSFTQSKDVDATDPSVWTEFSTSTDFVVNCTAVGNPVVNITIEENTNTTDNFANVNFDKYSNVSGGFKFTKSLVNNTGTYTCSATNGFESNSITFQVFVGGAPSNVTFTNVTVDYFGPEIYIQFNVTDESDAPAKGVYVKVHDLDMDEIIFSDPNTNVSKQFNHMLKPLLNETAPMMYDVELVAFNDLGNGSVMSSSLFIAGTDFSVNITTSNTNVSEKSDFMIMCTSSIEDANISLTVNGIDSSEVSNVKEIKTTNFSKTYNLTAEPENNGDVFVCMVVVEYLNTTSDEVAINVLYAPRFQDNNNATKWSSYMVNSSFVLNCTLNSTGNPPSAGFRYINVTNEFSNVNATLSNTSLSYEVTNATVENKVNLTCIAESSFAETTFTYLAFVGDGAPDNVTVTTQVNVINGIVFLTFLATDDSEAPAQIFFLNIPGIYNQTIKPESYSNYYVYDKLINKSAELFGKDQDKHYLTVAAFNDLGSKVVYNKTVIIPIEVSSSVSFTTTVSPTNKPAPSGGSNAGAIAAGIIVPVVVLILVGFGAAAAYYFYKNRKSQGFKLLSPTGADMDESGGHGYGTHTKT